MKVGNFAEAITFQINSSLECIQQDQYRISTGLKYRSGRQLVRLSYLSHTHIASGATTRSGQCLFAYTSWEKLAHTTVDRHSARERVLYQKKVTARRLSLATIMSTYS